MNGRKERRKSCFIPPIFGRKECSRNKTPSPFFSQDKALSSLVDTAAMPPPPPLHTPPPLPPVPATAAPSLVCGENRLVDDHDEDRDDPKQDTSSKSLPYPRLTSLHTPVADITHKYTSYTCTYSQLCVLYIETNILFI